MTARVWNADCHLYTRKHISMGNLTRFPSGSGAMTHILVCHLILRWKSHTHTQHTHNKKIPDVTRTEEISFRRRSSHDHSTSWDRVTSVPQRLNVFDPMRYRELMTISPGVSPSGLWSICVFVLFWFQLAPLQSTQQHMFSWSLIRIFFKQEAVPQLAD